MSDQTLLICGLPSSGKTTFLAALWHLVISGEITTEVVFESLRRGDAQHLNMITRLWRQLTPQERTLPSAHRLVSMHLKRTAGGEAFVLTFPDLSGEAFDQLWEMRQCSSEFRELAKGAAGVILFVQADTIRAPLPLVDLAALESAIGGDRAEEAPADWQAGISPTQVKAVELLQMLSAAPLSNFPRRISVVLSAWDKVAPEGVTPESFVARRLPLLAQYLKANADICAYKIFGVSAQGGDIGAVHDRQRLGDIDKPSERIQVVDDTDMTHDLTRVLSWAMK